jgi:hypothetical protein
MCLHLMNHVINTSGEEHSLYANLADVRPEGTFSTAVLAAVLVPALRLLQRRNESQHRGKVQSHREVMKCVNGPCDDVAR